MNRAKKYEAIELLKKNGIETLLDFMGKKQEELNVYCKYRGEYWNNVKAKATSETCTANEYLCKHKRHTLREIIRNFIGGRNNYIAYCYGMTK